MGHRSEVRAVIMESTGDVSVLTTDTPIEAWMFDHVRDGHRVAGASCDSPTADGMDESGPANG